MSEEKTKIIKENEPKKNTIKKQNKENKKNNKNTIITISILLFIGIVAFVGITRQMVINSEKLGYVSLQPVNVTLNSNGAEHKVSIKITLGGKNKQLNKLNMEKVQQVAKQAISNLDYDSIVKKEGSQYIKDTILQSLKSQFGDSIQNVVLDNILTDVTVPYSSQSEDSSNTQKRENYLKGFSWTNKK